MYIRWLFFIRVKRIFYQKFDMAEKLSKQHLTTGGINIKYNSVI